MKWRLWQAPLSGERLRAFEANPAWRASLPAGAGWTDAARRLPAVRRAYAALPSCAAAALRAHLLLFAAQPAEEERLLAALVRSTPLTGAECRLGLEALRQAGALFALRRFSGERLWCMPLETFECWLQAAFPGEPGRPGETLRLAPAAESEAPPPPFGLQLLRAWSTLAALDTKLTAKGTLPKPVTGRLAQAFRSDIPLPERFAAQREAGLPAGAVLALEAGFAFRVLERKDNRLAFHKDYMAAWLAQDGEERERRLQEWMGALLLADSPSFAHAWSMVRALPPGEWFEVRGLARQLAQMRRGMAAPAPDMPEAAVPEADEQAVARCCRVFQSLGWLEPAESEACGPVVRRRVLPETQATELIVQPDGELLALPGCPFPVLWELELIADRIGGDEHLSVYRMSGASLARAMKHGRTIGTIGAFLTEAGGGQPLPGIVEAMAREWMRGHPASEDAAYVSAYEDAAYPSPFGTQGCLSKAPGFSAPSSWSSAGEGELRLTFAVPDHFVPGMPPQDEYGLDDRPLPDQGPGWGEANGLPGMWVRQLRSYHVSTERELMERALQLETSVELRLGGGLRSFVPFKLEKRGESWEVVGKLRDDGTYAEVRLAPGMWEQMRMQLPEECLRT